MNQAKPSIASLTRRGGGNRCAHPALKGRAKITATLRVATLVEAGMLEGRS
ncbi:MAG: hypothetical protein M3539_13890 [Acidobacteriota bacterium]|nr:hypothetical protein [Acidobacteriota bacterium]